MNFSNIIINRNINIIENFDKFILIRYYFEKIKKVNFFIVWYVLFFKELKIKKLEKINNIKEKTLFTLNNINNINNNTRTNNDNLSKENDSLKEEKNNMNNILSKKNECIDLYNHIYNDLKHLSLNNVNSEHDLTGLIYVTQNNYFFDENNINNNINNNFVPCNEQKKNFFLLAFHMLNLTKEIENIPEEKINLDFNNSKKIDDDDDDDDLDDDDFENNNDENNNENKRFNKKIKLKIDFYQNNPFFYEKQAIELISNFYIKTHPYFSDIKLLCAKELIKKWKFSNNNNEELENKIENYFQNSIDNALKCLSKNNIFLANIALDCGIFYANRNDYLNAVKILNFAYFPFKQNSQDFQKDYYMFLKRFIKYNIKLGNYKNALNYGDELLNENMLFRNEKDSKLKEYLNKNLHLERIVYNLALLTLKTKEFERGIKYCQTLDKNFNFNFSSSNNAIAIGSLINNNNNDNNNNNIQIIKNNTEYISWLKGKEEKFLVKKIIDSEVENMNVNNNNNNANNVNNYNKIYEKKLRDREYRLKLKLYLKLIIRSLNEDNKFAYLQALLRIYDSSEEKKEIKKIGNPSLETVKMYLEGKGDLNEYFKGKIISSLKNKNRDDDLDKIQNKEKEQNLDYETFRVLYCYFKNDNVFYSFIEKNDPRYYVVKDDIDDADKDNVKEDSEKYNDEEYSNSPISQNVIDEY